MKVPIFGLLMILVGAGPLAMAEPPENADPRPAPPCPEKPPRPAAEPHRHGRDEPRRGRAPAPDRGKKHPGREAWRRLDTNGDGRVSYEEFAANPRLAKVPEDRKREIFRRMDKNGDGWIQLRELRPPAHGPRGGPMRLRELDANHDGKITYREFSRGRMISRLPEEKRRTIFRKMDRNGDGVLSPRDHPEPHPPGAHRHPPQPPRPPFFMPLKKLDRDGNGGVDFKEFSEGRGPQANLPEKRRRALFDKLDRNGDGEIRRNEAPNWNKPAAPRDAAEKNPRPEPAPKRRNKEKNKERNKEREKPQSSPPIPSGAV